MKEIIDSRIALVVSNILLWIGIVVIMSSLGYLIFNISKADSFITMWALSMTIGVSFTFISMFINIIKKLSQKKKVAFTN